MLENINLAGSNIDCVIVVKVLVEENPFYFSQTLSFKNAVNLSSFSDSFSIIFRSCKMLKESSWKTIIHIAATENFEAKS